MPGSKAKTIKEGSSSRKKSAGRPSLTFRSSTSKKKSSNGRQSVAAKSVKKSKAATKKNAKIQENEMPQWLSRISLLLVTACMLCVFWLFLIRPYSYRWRPCSGAKEFGTCIPSGYAAYGIDVSHYQGAIDWQKVHSAGKQYKLEFVYLKATEGGNFKDENYDVNISEARLAGMRCGSYHFYNPATSPGKQADFFIQNASVLPGDMPPVLDIEHKGGAEVQLQKDVLEWLRMVERHYGVKPVIYTSYKFKQHYLTNPAFDDYTFWIAHYYVDKPAQDCGWTMWQFTDRGRVPGIAGYTDMDVFSGSRREFSDFTVK